MIAELTKLLREEEGEVLHAYKDHLGYLTIGVGRLIDAKKGGGITKEESAFLLANDIEKCKAQVLANLPWVVKLSEPRQGVLIAMAFQMGINGLLKFKNTLAYINQGNYIVAAKGMLESKWAKQTPKRAERMALIMETGTWN